MDGVAQRYCNTAFRRLNIVRSDVFEALTVATEPSTPFGLDGSWWRVLELLDYRPRLSFCDLDECRIRRSRCSSISALIERHVG